MAPSPPKTFCEFFAGIGLVGRGLKASGWRCAYANDICPQKQALYQQYHGPSETYHLEDIRETDKIVARIPGRPHLATASFPCVDLSLAGKYQGLQGRHSSTFFSFIEVLKALGERRPQLVLLENVMGFLSARQGRDFQAAIRELADLEYVVDAVVVNASHFRPQSRPRVFVIGARRAANAHSKLSEMSDSELRPARLAERTAALSSPWLKLDFPSLPQRKIALEDVLSLEDNQAWWSEEQVERHRQMLSPRHESRLETFLNEPGKRWGGAAFRRMRERQQKLEVRFDGLAGCLRTPSGGSAKQIVVAADDGRLRMRWMNAREYALLQGAEDFPLAGVSETQLLKAFADAVCTPVIDWLDQCALTPLWKELAK